MSRSALEIREAEPADAAELLALWEHSGRTDQPARPLEEAAGALAQVAAAPDERLVVGLYEGRIVAAVHLRRAPLSPLHIESVVHTSYLVVHPDHRRHGYARALLDHALAWAEEKDVTHITAIAMSSSRDTNRFLARLGLATAWTVRVGSTHAMRRRLHPDPIRSRDTRRQLGRVLAQRRSVQRRSAEG